MTFVVTHRISAVYPEARAVDAAVPAGCWRTSWRAGFALTPQERANLYVSRMPIAVVAASLGGHPND